MTRWLLETGLLELVSLGLFLWMYLYPGQRLWAGDGWPYAPAGMLTLGVVLVEGGVYWLVKFWLLSGRRTRRGSPEIRLRGLQALYVFNVVLLLVFPVVLSVGIVVRGVGKDLPGLLLGVGLYVFAVGEFVHYFLWKINMRSAERASARRGSRRIPARFLRELRRARADVQRSRNLGVGNRRSL
ncbi:hypothetical protein [Streptosporangium sp. NPDC049046]